MVKTIGGHRAACLDPHQALSMRMQQADQEDSPTTPISGARSSNTASTRAGPKAPDARRSAAADCLGWRPSLRRRAEIDAAERQEAYGKLYSADQTQLMIKAFARSGRSATTPASRLFAAA